MISVLNSTDISDSDISLYLDYVLGELYEYKIVETFKNVTEGIVFIQIGEDAYDYPYLDGKDEHKILYVYLTGYRYVNMIDVEGCEVGMSLTLPKYNVKIGQFKTTLECINKLKDLKNTCNKLNEFKKEKHNQLFSVIDQLLSDISGIDDIRKEYIRLLSAPPLDDDIPVIPLTKEGEVAKLRNYFIREMGCDIPKTKPLNIIDDEQDLKDVAAALMESMKK